MTRDAPLSFRIDRGLRTAIAQLAKKEKRSVSQTVILLIEEALASRGLLDVGNEDKR